jgi:hypothetical protein
MTEMELLNRLTAIRDKAEVNDDNIVIIMIEELIYERWGK